MGNHAIIRIISASVVVACCYNAVCIATLAATTVIRSTTVTSTATLYCISKDNQEEQLIFVAIHPQPSSIHPILPSMISDAVIHPQQ
eukprot:8551757-Pyramimonas_sp.AAC.1